MGDIRIRIYIRTPIGVGMDYQLAFPLPRFVCGLWRWFWKWSGLPLPENGAARWEIQFPIIVLNESSCNFHEYEKGCSLIFFTSDFLAAME